MGTTGRKRKNKKLSTISNSLEHETNLIELKTNMALNGWENNSKLQLRDFPETGRGLTSKINVNANDILISVPYNLMITYNTLESTNFFDNFSPKLTILDSLVTFLALEKHKNKQSNWRFYVNSLPNEAPTLPWLLSIEEINLLPQELQLYAKTARNNFEESWLRITKSIDKNWTCNCCKRNVDCVLDLNLFTWSYVLVNTRAVYVDPQLICNFSNDRRTVLVDEPSMALCPFLDMFNHSFLARTKAELNCVDGGQPVYQLTTLTAYKKFNQIFISYGSHDNIKLLMEYGFFIRGNSYDVVSFSYKEVLDTLGLHLNRNQKNFILGHDFNKSLYVDDSAGASFSLKAVLFVVLNSQINNYSQTIYKDSYPELFLLKQIPKLIKQLLEFKLAIVCEDLNRLSQNNKNQKLDLVLSFINYRKKFINTLINKTNVKFSCK